MIATIEKPSIIEWLKSNGIPQGSGQWSDYERGKRIVCRIAESSRDYNDMIEAVCSWVGV